MSATDYLAEILPWNPASPPATGLPEPVDVTSRVRRAALGSINRAVERDFLSFRTGDLTFSLRNQDGFLDNLFVLFGPGDRWQFLLQLEGRTLFRGIILGQGSVSFDRKKKSVEITAYGPTRMLMDASATGVARTVPDMTVTTATSGATTMTLNTTAGLLTGDVLHVTNQVSREDVTVKQVTSATVVSLEAALLATYVAGSPVVLTTKFYRYKTVDFLARELFKAAGVAAAQIKTTGSLFRKAASSPVNLQGLNITLQNITNPAEKEGKPHVMLLTSGDYSQASPDAAWVQEDANQAPWVDWSRYYRQDEAKPTIFLRNVIAGVDSTENSRAPHTMGWDWRSATKRAWWLKKSVTPDEVRVQTSADGVAWGADALQKTLVGNTFFLTQIEYDPVRNALYLTRDIAAGDSKDFEHLDVASGTLTSLMQPDDGAKFYMGPVYVPELDALLVLRGATVTSQNLEIAAFRGTGRLWVRPFPPIASGTQNFPTCSLRYLAGSLYCIAIIDGDLKLVRSDDEFQTYSAKTIQAGTGNNQGFGARILDQYRVVGYRAAGDPRHYSTAAPFYAGVVNYADFSNKSCGEALKALAVLTNSVFLLDDDLQAFFVSRDLLPRQEVVDITALVKETKEVLVWEETHLYALVSGGGFTEGAGDIRFIGSAAEVSSDLLPNASYADSLARAYADFYSPLRRQLAVVVRNPDVHVYQPLDRVLIDGVRYVVLENDTEIGRNQVTMKLVQDV